MADKVRGHACRTGGGPRSSPGKLSWASASASSRSLSTWPGPGALLLGRSTDTDLSTALAFERQVTRTMATPTERHEARMRAAASDPAYVRILAQVPAPHSSTRQGTNQ
jgi:hypothetical protein